MSQFNSLAYRQDRARQAGIALGTGLVGGPAALGAAIRSNVRAKTAQPAPGGANVGAVYGAAAPAAAPAGPAPIRTKWEDEFMSGDAGAVTASRKALYGLEGNRPIQFQREALVRELQASGLPMAERQRRRQEFEGNIRLLADAANPVRSRSVGEVMQATERAGLPQSFITPAQAEARRVGNALASLGGPAGLARGAVDEQAVQGFERNVADYAVRENRRDKAQSDAISELRRRIDEAAKLRGEAKYEADIAKDRAKQIDTAMFNRAMRDIDPESDPREKLRGDIELRELQNRYAGLGTPEEAKAWATEDRQYQNDLRRQGLEEGKIELALRKQQFDRESKIALAALPPDVQAKIDLAVEAGRGGTGSESLAASEDALNMLEEAAVGLTPEQRVNFDRYIRSKINGAGLGENGDTDIGFWDTIATVLTKIEKRGDARRELTKRLRGLAKAK